MRNCTDIEILLSDLIDGTLDAATAAEVESHLSSCASCQEQLADQRALLAFMDTAADVEPPPQLITRILYQGPARVEEVRKSASLASRIREKLRLVLQPRFAMGMAMTILSFSMLGKFVAPVKQLKPSDLDPVKVWSVVEDRAHRTFDRGVKYYESLRLVWEIQSRLQDWTEQEEEARRNDNQKKVNSNNNKAGTNAASPDSAPLPERDQPSANPKKESTR